MADTKPSKVSLDDLNNDPNLIYTLNGKALADLDEQANTEQYPLAGNLGSTLSKLAREAKEE